MSAKIPCDGKGKNSINLADLMQIAKKLDLKIPKKISKRDLCVMLNQLTDEKQIEIVEKKLNSLNFKDEKNESNPASVGNDENTNQNVVTSTKEDNSKKLFDALISCDLESVKKYAPNKESLNSIIMHGAMRSNVEIIEYLINLGNLIEEDNGGLVLLAVFYNNFNIAKYLILHGAKINPPEGKNGAVHVLFKKIKQRKNNDTFPNINIFYLLLSHGADFNVAGEDGKTPLAIAIEENYSAGVRVLLESCVNTTYRGKSILDFAKESNRPEIETIISSFLKLNRCGNTPDRRTIKFPEKFVTVNDKKLEQSYFSGTDLNKLVSIDYFISHYRDVCVATSEAITFDCTDAKCIRLKFSDSFFKMFERCRKNREVRFVFGFVSLISGDRGHSNAFVVDLKDVNEDGQPVESVEIFEPHGKGSEKLFHQTDYKQRLSTFFSEQFHIKRILFSGDICPSFDLQRKQKEENEKEYSDPGGYCQAWTTWWLEYRLANPKFSKETLMSFATERFAQQRKQISMTKFIRNYAESILKYRDEIFSDICTNALRDYDEEDFRYGKIVYINREIKKLEKNPALGGEVEERKKELESLKARKVASKEKMLRALKNSLESFLDYEIQKKIILLGNE